MAEASSPALVDAVDRLEPARLARVIGVGSVLGGILTFVSIIAPHDDHTYDVHYVVLGALVVAFGAALQLAGRAGATSLVTVHASLVVLSVAVLALSWLGMRDLGGVQSVLLVVLLGIAASLGPTWWAAAFGALQSAGYAIVLATSADVAGFDKFSQWQVVTIALVVSLAFVDMLRRELLLTRARDKQLQRERDQERLQHAARLQQLNDQLHETNELKSSFVAMASHELRTPLTAIEGFAATMQYRWEDLDDDDKRAFVAIIDAQSKRLGRLVGDLLTISRIESGRLHARPESVTLRDAVARALTSLGPIPDVHVECPAETRAFVDPDHLQQVLVNYLANAVTHGARPVTVCVREDGDDVSVAVCDQGSGIDPSFEEDLFDRFTRAPEAAASEVRGTGLGLSIVRGLVEANAGSAWYTPNEPRGSCFWLRVPRAVA